MKRFLLVAQSRPLAEYRREVVLSSEEWRTRESRATWKRAALTLNDLHAAMERAHNIQSYNLELIAHLERARREWELIYQMLALTGPLKSERASMTVG